MSDTLFVAGTTIASSWLNDVNDAVYTQTSGLTGAVPRSLASKLRDFVSVKDFGAVGTANIANQAADTAAFALARAAADVVYVPEGTYYLSGSPGYTIGPGQSLIGAGSGKTIITCSGAGNGIYMGAPGNLSLAYDCTLRGINLVCTNRASTVNGVYLDNAVYFTLDDVTCVGSGDPNSVVPANTVLYGAGVVITNNSIIGRLNKVSCRIWEIGRYYKTLTGSSSYWTAAIEDCGQGELANNMIGLRVGDPTVAHQSGAGVHIHDLAIQGNYALGMDLNAAENTSVDHCYFEANAIHDITVGGAVASPLRVRILHNRMSSESIGLTAYGSAVANQYTDKISLITGAETHIFDNDCQVTLSVPLIRVAAACTDTSIKDNRLNSLAAVPARISNSSTTTITADNSPEAPRVIHASFNRTLSAATGNVSYTGVGFRPTAIEFSAAVDTGVEFSLGGCDASSGLENRCITADAAGAILSSANCIRIIKASAGNEQKATLVSMDADGFTLAWTLIGAPPANTLIVNYTARR